MQVDEEALVVAASGGIGRGVLEQVCHVPAVGGVVLVGELVR